MTLINRKWLDAILIWSCSLVGFYNVMLVPPLIIDFMSIFGINYSYASLAMGSYGLMYTIGGVISGYLSTKIGARKSVFLGILLIAIAHLTISVSSTYNVIILLRGLVGIGTAMIWTASILLLKSYFDNKEIAVAYSGLSSFLSVGAMLSVFSASRIVIIYGINYIFFISGISALIISILFIICVQKLKEKTEEDIKLNNRKNSWFGIILVGIMNFTLLFQVYALITWLPAYLEEAVLITKENIGYLMSIFVFVTIPAAIIGGQLIKKIGEANKIVLLAIIISFSSILFVMPISDIYYIIILMIITSWGANMVLAQIYTLINKVTNAKFFSKATGIVASMGFSAAFVASYLNGYLLDIYHSYNVIFYTICIICIIGLFANMIFTKRFM